MKQETLEEAAEKYSKNELSKLGFINGAKWQAEKMYSEEELQQKIDAHLEVAKDLWLSTIKEQKKMYSEEEVQVKLYECLGYFAQKHNIIINGNEIDQWFEQFKKK